MIWRVSQPIVCVSAVGRRREVTPIQGAVYHIREIISDPDQVTCTCFLLREIVNEPRWLVTHHGESVFAEMCFSSWRFRPAVDRPTSIAIFTEILDRENLRQKVPLSVE